MLTRPADESAQRVASPAGDDIKASYGPVHILRNAERDRFSMEDAGIAAQIAEQRDGSGGVDCNVGEINDDSADGADVAHQRAVHFGADDERFALADGRADEADVDFITVGCDFDDGRITTTGSGKEGCVGAGTAEQVEDTLRVVGIEASEELLKQCLSVHP